MKRQRVGREVELFRYVAGGHPVRSGLHQQAENIETIVLGESGQRRHGVGLFHISIDMEMSYASQETFQEILKRYK